MLYAEVVLGPDDIYPVLRRRILNLDFENSANYFLGKMITGLCQLFHQKHFQFECANSSQIKKITSKKYLVNILPVLLF